MSSTASPGGSSCEAAGGRASPKASPASSKASWKRTFLIIAILPLRDRLARSAVGHIALDPVVPERNDRAAGALDQTVQVVGYGQIAHRYRGESAGGDP